MTSRSFFLNSEMKEMAQTHNGLFNSNYTKNNSDMKEFIQESSNLNGTQETEINGNKTSELRTNNDVIINKYDRKLNGSQERALITPLNQSTKKPIIIQQDKRYLKYKKIENSVESTDINPSRQTNHDSEITKNINEELTFPNQNYPPHQINIKRGRRIKKIRIQKSHENYGVIKSCKNRGLIRSVPRHISRK